MTSPDLSHRRPRRTEREGCHQAGEPSLSSALVNGRERINYISPDIEDNQVHEMKRAVICAVGGVLFSPPQRAIAAYEKELGLPK